MVMIGKLQNNQKASYQKKKLFKLFFLFIKYKYMNHQEQKYWSDFYKNFNLLQPSDFCIFIKNFLRNIINTDKKQLLLDIGCGNGRDSKYLSDMFDVTGIDISCLPSGIENCKFYIADMIEYDKTKYDIIYSRFTFHSITDQQQMNLLKSIKKQNTILCIETRSIKDKETFRVHGNTHFRNLTDIENLKKMLSENGFQILYIEEKRGIAIFNEEDPICIRVICKKTH
jgi:tellurite methyltransferase